MSDLIIKYKCYECGFNDKVVSKDRKIQCPCCKTINDFWLDGELPPINHR